MSTLLSKKIDFAVILRVTNANPNGDPLNGNRPRAGYDGIGEITDVCLKRKLRDRLQEMGEAIFVQSDDRKNDDAKSLQSRASAKLGDKLGSSDGTRRIACDTWFDVRAFGQLFAYKNPKKKTGKKAEGEESSEGDSGISIAIRGPVTIQSAFSLQSVEITSTQITKSVSGEDPKEGKSRASDTMGMKHRVDQGVYVFYGSMNPQLAERTGFSDADAEKIKAALPRLFENDASSARPEGSIEVLKVVWWQHNSKAGQYSSAKVHRTLRDKLENSEDGSFKEDDLENALLGLKPEFISGF
ncbi:MAG: type I-C CRISPR-associated protein Cas7/Csd2 [Proteobacteria bacterium]|nr:type I-C CRISPR-associated protein Cas7/Csd2 [Pseudomonadota bacterium]MCL2306916.1 type I-C CRISPR-associated protein Cas7/Csd2 [Pseudomonadota bacterium]